MSKAINGVEPTEWAKHLRPDGKKAFWKRHRAAKVEIPAEETAALFETKGPTIIVDEETFDKIAGKIAKKKKKFGFEYRYKEKPKWSWIFRQHEKWDEWKPYWSWYKTAKARDAAYKSLSKSSYGVECWYEFRKFDR